jgi:hypothetical protein
MHVEAENNLFSQKRTPFKADKLNIVLVIDQNTCKNHSAIHCLDKQTTVRGDVLPPVGCQLQISIKWQRLLNK